VCTTNITTKREKVGDAWKAGRVLLEKKEIG
jgi:hypothetical protein